MDKGVAHQEYMVKEPHCIPEAISLMQITYVIM